MKSLMDILSLVVGFAATMFAVYQFYLFAVFRNASGTYDVQGGTNHLWLAIAAAVVACVCLLAFFLRRVNKEEEIHITQ